jgi:hypothetical protein
MGAEHVEKAGYRFSLRSLSRVGRSGPRSTGGHGKSVGLTGVDDWLKTQIRLAERQGVLRGQHLSPVQTKALVVLNFLDDIQKHEGDIAALKRAFLSSGLAEPSKIFPEAFQDNEDTQNFSEVPNDENVNFDYSGVTWKSGGDAYAEYESLMAKINAMRSGVMSGDTLVQRAPEWTEWR